MLRFSDIVFGPVHSRRLGSSLGINLLPGDGKLCNFDCIYCECGWNRDGRSLKPVLPAADDVQNALEAKLKALSASGVGVDSITFSGNGEPTLNPEFPEIVERVLRLRDIYIPLAKVSVFSNATMIGNTAIREALKKVDNPILKIDACSDRGVLAVNRPSGPYSLEEVVRNMKCFEGNFVLQTMFLRYGETDLTHTECLERWMDLVREVRPREIMAYTIDRETPDRSLSKCAASEIEEYVTPLIREGFNIQIRG
ncbi:MAG: radical SAM protein [Candidatus Cryptobacteroides sp.]